MNICITYLIILVLLFGVELFYFKIADKCNIIDKPNLRSSHTSITLRGGVSSSWQVYGFGLLSLEWFILGF